VNPSERSRAARKAGRASRRLTKEVQGWRATACATGRTQIRRASRRIERHPADSGQRPATGRSLHLGVARGCIGQAGAPLCRSIGEGSFRPTGHDGSGLLGGLLFSRDEVQARIASFSVQVLLTAQQISHQTGAHYDAVKAWIDTGMLPATQSLSLQGRPWMVKLRHFVQFLLHFSPLASLAEQLRSSSRGLADDLARRGVCTTGAMKRGAVVRIGDLVRPETKK
jgi:hypothetical protein